MAQQTINVGTAPNDGTGTPLRTAFQYTNSNFSELYTALGGGSGLPGAANQIIFNNGSSLAGNANLTFNTALNKLVANNIETAANLLVGTSATITGNLTVDTNTLFVDSANDRVGVGTVSPTAKLHVSSTGSVHINQRTGNNGCFTQYMDPTSSNYVGTDSGNFRVANNSGQDLLNIQQLGVFTFGDGAGGTRMTLNATGLGVGRSPSYRLQASSGTKATTASLATVAGITTTDADDFGIYFRLKTDATGANRYAAITSFDNGSGNGARDLVLQDLGGNVGIGVTPSASKLQVAGNIGLPNSCTASGETSGVFSIDVANLLTLNGSNWRQASILIVYSGIDGAATNATVLQTVVTLSGLSTWNTIAKNDIVGTASVAVSASTATGATITFTVPTGNTGSVYAMLLGGGGTSTRPSMTVNA